MRQRPEPHLASARRAGKARPQTTQKRSLAVPASFVEDAIEQLRKVGNQDERITALRHRLEQLQRAGIQAMPVMPLPEQNTAALEGARAHVAGKPVEQAVLWLAFGIRPDSIDGLEQHDRESAEAHRAQTLMPASYVGPRGATEATHGGLGGDDVAQAFATEVMRAAAKIQELKAEYFVAPALEQVMADHNLETAFFLALARRSGFVPQNRERSYGLGLAAGAQGDFDVAAALLFPQFEHAVREVFHKNAVVTTTLPSSGIQDELDLNVMLKHEATAKIFGARQAYDLRVLLVEKAGSNLRNDLAHGVIDDGARVAAKAYFWWICFRFAIDPFVELREAPLPGSEGEDSST